MRRALSRNGITSFLLLLCCAFLGTGNAKAISIEELAENLDGKTITKISFRGRSNLNSDDLIRPLAIRPGDRIEKGNLIAAQRTLFQRGIYENVDVQADVVGEEVALRFLLSPVLRIGEVTLSGAEQFEEQALRRAVGIRQGTSLQLDTLQRGVDRLSAYLRTRGYFQPKVRVRINERLGSSDVVAEFNVESGSQAVIGEIAFERELTPDVAANIERLVKSAQGDEASQERIKLFVRQLLFSLRNDGYLQASVRQPTVEYRPDSDDVRLKVTVSQRQPLTINFSGNTVFSAAELLMPLGLETRTVPFTPGAIPALCRTIERMYQEQGYYFAQAECAEGEPVGERRIYYVVIVEGGRHELSEIHFIGNTIFPDATLRSQISTEERAGVLFGRWRVKYPTIARIARDALSIEEFYSAHGYPDAEVKTKFYLDDAGKFIGEFAVNEGAKEVLASVDVQWIGVDTSDNAESSFASELLSIVSHLHAGDIYVAQAVEEEKRRILQELYQRGYANAAVDVEEETAPHSVRFVITPGEKITIEKILVKGNIYTHDNVILREVSQTPGAVWLQSELEASEARLLATGLFRSVKLESEDGAVDSPQETLLVSVEERDTGAFDLGVGVDTEDGLHVTGELGQRNLEGRGNSLAFVLDGYFKPGDQLFDSGRMKGIYQQKHFLAPENTLLVESFVQKSVETFDEFSFDRIGFSTGVSRNFGDGLSGTAGILGLQERLFDVSPDVIAGPNDTGAAHYIFARTELELDLRDDPFNPTRGTRTILQSRVGSDAIGSDVSMYVLSGQQSFYLPLRSDLVWANRVEGELARAFGDTDVVPITQRFFLGGRNSLRGFTRYKVGPRGFLNGIAGGDTAVVANTELQYSWTESFLSVLFLDVGQSYLVHPGDFVGDRKGLSELRYSPGVGLRYKTPIGPIGAEYGLALDREAGERPGRFFVGIGGAF